jgi:toxin ParE1/3/4
MIEDAAKYIARDSPAAARRLAVNAVDAAESLSDLSERGRVVPELNDVRYRELFVGSYRLVYRVEDEHIAIIAFVHGARDFRSWWKRHNPERPPN